MSFLLYIRHASGFVQTMTFRTDFARSLVLITLVALPVDVRIEDVAVAS
jgi:hypothetical protein